MDRLKPWQPLALSAVVVAVLCGYHFQSPEFRRPLQEDELITLRVYTGAGTKADGTPRDLRRREQLDAIPPLAPSELVVGFYCSLGRWTEPNNHVVHSALVNLFLGRIHPIEAAVRLPALIAAGAFALALAFLCIRCGYFLGAPVASAFALSWPYVSWYAAESRGYALMLLLLVLFALALRWLLKRPGLLWAGIALTAATVLTVVNLVNLSADWIAPAFLVALAFPRWIQPEIDDVKHARKSLFIVGLAAASILGVFVVDRLPSLVSSMNQYGVPYRGASGFGEQALAMGKYLFPTLAAKVLGTLGVIGALLALRNPSARGFVILGFGAWVLSALHFAAAGKFPYLRNGGYFLLPILFGLAALAEFALARIGAAPIRWAIVIAWTAVGVAVEFIQPVPNPDPNYESFAKQLAETPSDGTPGRVILEPRVPKSLDLYFPNDWEPVEMPWPAFGTIDIVRIEKTGDDYSKKSERYAIRERGPADRLVWQPPFAATAVSPDAILKELAEAGAKTIRPFHARYHAKLSVHSRVTVILADGTDETALQAVADKYGGTLLRLTRK